MHSLKQLRSYKVAYSYSKLDLYNRCSQAYKYKYVDKLVPTLPPSEALRRGSQVHKDIENGIINSEATKWAAQVAPVSKTKIVANKLKINWKSPYVVQNEVKIGFNQQSQPCEFDDQECYYRGVIDRVNIHFSRELLNQQLATNTLDLNGCVDEVSIYDWKTGRVYKSKGLRQLGFYALYYFIKYPNLKTVVGHLCNVDSQHEDVKTWKRNPDEKALDTGLRMWIYEIEKGVEQNVFNRCRTPLCKYCEYRDVCEKDINNLAAKMDQDFLTAQYDTPIEL